MGVVIDLRVGAGRPIEGHENEPPGIKGGHRGGGDAEPEGQLAEPAMGGKGGFEDDVLRIITGKKRPVRGRGADNNQAPRPPRVSPGVLDIVFPPSS